MRPTSQNGPVAGPKSGERRGVTTTLQGQNTTMKVYFLLDQKALIAAGVETPSSSFVTEVPLASLGDLCRVFAEHYSPETGKLNPWVAGDSLILSTPPTPENCAAVLTAWLLRQAAARAKHQREAEEQRLAREEWRLTAEAAERAALTARVLPEGRATYPWTTVVGETPEARAWDIECRAEWNEGVRQVVAEERAEKERQRRKTLEALPENLHKQLEDGLVCLVRDALPAILLHVGIGASFRPCPKSYRALKCVRPLTYQKAQSIRASLASAGFDIDDMSQPFIRQEDELDGGLCGPVLYNLYLSYGSIRDLDVVVEVGQ